MSGRVLILTLWICAGIRAADTDPAVALARILAAKGTITNAQLESVIAASGNARVATLASILQRKGLLNESEIAQLGTAPVSMPVATKPAPVQTADLPVTTHAG